MLLCGHCGRATGCDGQRKLLRNRAKCAVCGQVVESAAVHEFSRCGCGQTAVDGGLDYAMHSGAAEDLCEHGPTTVLWLCDCDNPE